MEELQREKRLGDLQSAEQKLREAEEKIRELQTEVALGGWVGSGCCWLGVQRKEVFFS